MSTEQPSLNESIPPHKMFLAGVGAQYGRGSKAPQRPAEDSRSTPQCECGEDITQWSDSVADARRWVRVYGDPETGLVPACPDCVSYRDEGDDIDNVPTAIREMEVGSSIERRDRRALAIQQYRPSDDGGR